MTDYTASLTRKQMHQLGERIVAAVTLSMPNEVEDFLGDEELDELLIAIKDETVFALQRAEDRRYDEWLNTLPAKT